MRKLRLAPTPGDPAELELGRVDLPPGATLHCYVASNRLDGPCGYDVEVRCDRELEEAPEPAPDDDDDALGV